jgi:putative DNA primase/helicase
MGWAKKNLSESDREAIARSLFAVSEERNGWLNGSCPLHDDTNPSFGYHVADDVYHCHASCTEDGDLVDLFCRVNSLDNKTGFTEFKKRFGGGGNLPPAKKTDTTRHGTKSGVSSKESKSVDLQLMREAYGNFPPLPDETIVRLEKERGWSRQTIKDLGIRLQTQYWDKKTGTLKATVKKFARIAIPIHECGELMNVRLYSLDDKANKIMSFGAGVGENRLFPEPPDPAKASGLVWLCEGESDTVCAKSHGLEAYTQTGKRKKWPAEQVEKFRGRDVVIAYDCDQAGVKYAQGAAKSLLDVAASIRVIDWPDVMKVNGEIPEDHGQDLTDFFVKHGKTVGDLEALLPAANSVDNENTVYLGALAFFGATITGRFGYQPMLLAEQLLRDNELLYDKMGSGYLYRWNGKVWQVWSEEYLKKQCIDYLGREATPSRINDAVHLVLSLVLMPADLKMNDQAS